MNNSDLTKIINTNLRRKIPVYHASFSERSDDNFILASMLAHLGGFQSMLQVARSKLGINETHMKFLHKNKRRAISMAGQDYMPYGLSETGLKLLDKYAEEIRIYYKLASNWLLSIRLAVLTNILFLPPEHEPIRFSQTGAPRNYPAVYFTENVSIHQLKQFIQEKAEEIRKATVQMPKPKKHKAELRTILWGQVVSILIGNINVYLRDDFFAEIYRKLDEEIFKETKVPDKIELRNQYKRFLEYSISLEQTPVLLVKFPPETQS